jgi:hypothetical protein
MLAAFAVSAFASASSPTAPQPIVTIVRHGGLCASGSGSQCRQVLRITDTTIFGEGYLPRRLARAARTSLLRAIARLDLGYLRTHPFEGTCPTASDGTESVYRLRGFPRALPSCTYDLRGVQAVRQTERLLETLKRARLLEAETTVAQFDPQQTRNSLVDR